MRKADESIELVAIAMMVLGFAVLSWATQHALHATRLISRALYRASIQLLGSNCWGCGVSRRARELGR